MAKTYEVTSMRRYVNAVFGWLLRAGVKIPYTYLLTTKGRKTGKNYTTPVSLVEEGGKRWLVAPYGVVSWVRNARAAGQVTLSRGHYVEVLKIEPLDAAASASILQTYLRQHPITQEFFDVRPDSAPEAFAAEAERHPVFLLTPVGTS